ncbi:MULTISPECIES: ATP-dependent helicase [unclassified Corynebacterium]|uniref:ATP-dependent helicase n=1 Tax=unclassified Corynebacterium TaxID=2624378 RepID=UPI00216A66B5|nr:MULTISPECIES: DEAD/DEAH box helicase [unclassified Corynebacterium]MCS4489462.1 DEAD/DEAH box helicase [Corynebacterium sp. ES2775-CONJ]MCS4491527.1 DEAD/DEAH box helicase [Corynebacterium sp. ES2715-CONJ3]
MSDNRSTDIRLDPYELSQLLGQAHPPTSQQAAVISANREPLLVVAGAGAGKTETMAARVVWLAAQGVIDPSRVLGLTFTRKAAQQLSQRIRTRLGQLAHLPHLETLDPKGRLAENLSVIAPTVSTYDAFAGSLIREFGLLLPVEPGSRMITQAELFELAYAVVEAYDGELMSGGKTATAVQTLLDLVSELDNHMVSANQIIEESQPFINLFEELPKGPRQRDALNGDMVKFRDAQILRMQYLPLAQQLKDLLAERNLMTFGEQMSLAARLATENPRVSDSLAKRFDIVLLDEYQDTSHAQRVLLSELFAGQAVTAVGDPMQSIYGWRGATAANLERFVTDFAHSGNQVAPKAQLTMSFRNPPRILECANEISESVLGPIRKKNRSVEPLVSLPHADEGVVELGYYPSPEAECAAVAEKFADFYHNRGDSPFTAAVLVRKRKHMDLISHELKKRGVPVEILGSAGLVDIPEVADLIAVATILIRPLDSQAAMRILSSPMMGLSVADIEVLAQRARNLKGRMHGDEHPANRPEPAVDDDPTISAAEKALRTHIASAVKENPEEIVGLADAIADLGEAEGFSPLGLRRLKRLAAILRRLRRNILSQPLPDLFAQIESELGLRTEVLARENPRADGASGVVHLERFHEEVARYAQIPGASLSKFLDYLDLAREHDNGLSPGEVTVRTDRVQILTVHKAKGLEWRYVSVLHADANTYSARVRTWLTDPAQVPSTLRGDAQEETEQSGSPVLDLTEVEDRKQLETALKGHIQEFKEGAEEENTRLFYVALTRSEQYLIITASHNPSRKAIIDPYEHLAQLAKKHPDYIIHWWQGRQADGNDTDAQPENIEHQPSFFPPAITTPAKEEAAQLVLAAMEKVPAYSADYEIFEQWERDVQALIREYERQSTTEVEVALSDQLTATDIVALSENPEQFAKRQRRPIPFKPNTYAKRGTAFHSWLENRFGATSLLDEDQLPGVDEHIPDESLAELKKAFLASEWSDRSPDFVEQPFEVSIDGIVIRGRMDAIFRENDGSYMVVDWKTGHPPTAQKLRSTRLQLAVYRLAWARLKDLPLEQVRAGFYYISSGTMITFEQLPSDHEIAAMIANATGQADREKG